MAKEVIQYRKEQGKSKYARCDQCGLRIRCGNVEKHEAGWSHNHRGQVFKKH